MQYLWGALDMKNPVLLSIDDIRDLTHHNHYIPMTRLFHHDFMAERFPGWGWNAMLPKLQGRKIVRVHNGCDKCTRLSMGMCMDSDIEGVWVKLNPSGIRIKVIKRG